MKLEVTLEFANSEPVSRDDIVQIVQNAFRGIRNEIEYGEGISPITDDGESSCGHTVFIQVKHESGPSSSWRLGA